MPPACPHAPLTGKVHPVLIARSFDDHLDGVTLELGRAPRDEVTLTWVDQAGVAEHQVFAGRRGPGHAGLVRPSFGARLCLVTAWGGSAEEGRELLAAVVAIVRQVFSGPLVAGWSSLVSCAVMGAGEWVPRPRRLSDVSARVLQGA